MPPPVTSANDLQPTTPAPPPAAVDGSSFDLQRGAQSLPPAAKQPGATVTERTSVGVSSGERNGTRSETAGLSKTTTVTAPLGRDASLGIDNREGLNRIETTTPDGKRTSNERAIKDTGISVNGTLTKPGSNPSVTTQVRYGETQNNEGDVTPTVRGQVTGTVKLPLGDDTTVTVSGQARSTTDLNSGQTTGRVQGTAGIEQKIGDVTVGVSGSWREQKNFQTGVGGSGSSVQGTISLPVGKDATVGGFIGRQSGVNTDPSDGIGPTIVPNGQAPSGSTAAGVFYQQKF